MVDGDGRVDFDGMRRRGFHQTSRPIAAGGVGRRSTSRSRFSPSRAARPASRDGRLATISPGHAGRPVGPGPGRPCAAGWPGQPGREPPADQIGEAIRVGAGELGGGGQMVVQRHGWAARGDSDDEAGETGQDGRPPAAAAPRDENVDGGSDDGGVGGQDQHGQGSQGDAGQVDPAVVVAGRAWRLSGVGAGAGRTGQGAGPGRGRVGSGGALGFTGGHLARASLVYGRRCKGLMTAERWPNPDKLSGGARHSPPEVEAGPGVRCAGPRAVGRRPRNDGPVRLPSSPPVQGCHRGRTRPSS